MTIEEAERLLRKYYSEKTPVFQYLYEHSHAVAEYAVKIARQNTDKGPDINFIHTAALLHDIGIFMTHAPGIGCYGKFAYLAHGYLGRRLLEYEGYPGHALVCERHIGVGISKEEVISNNLPLPGYDMLPVSTEEEIVCYADKFFSKKPGMLKTPKDIVKIIKTLEKYGPGKADVFKGFMTKYGVLEE
ncbi:MAG: HD domain-containing protein [Bacteroidales bacterium]|nr:HD domain-containing protein [Bacteroidales bacterium]